MRAVEDASAPVYRRLVAWISTIRNVPHVSHTLRCVVYRRSVLCEALLFAFIVLPC